MKPFRSIPRILKINTVDGYELSLMFNNGESRIVNLKNFLIDKLGKMEGKIGFELVQNVDMVNNVKILGSTIGWEDLGRKSTDADGNEVFYPFDLDPLMLYDFSGPDESRKLQIGLKIKSARLEKGMTQKELAEKSGTTKYYISRIENDKSDIELQTPKKIVEAGLGKELTLEIK